MHLAPKLNQNCTLANEFNFKIWCVQTLTKHFNLLITNLSSQMLNALPDQDTFYDVTDALEEQGVEVIIQRHMNKKGSDLDLLEQFQIYESVLKHEDGDETGPIVGSSMGDIRYLTFNLTFSNLDFQLIFEAESSNFVCCKILSSVVVCKFKLFSKCISRNFFTALSLQVDAAYRKS